MAHAVASATHPTLVNSDGTRPSLVLWSTGMIVGWYGAGVPKNAPGDNTSGGGVDSVDWREQRFNKFTTTTTGNVSGEIAKDIIVTNWIPLDDISGHVLDGWGRIIPFGSNQTAIVTNPNPLNHYRGPDLLPGGPSPIGFDIMRKLRLDPIGLPAYNNGFVLDGWGGIHYCGNARLGTGQPDDGNFLPGSGGPFFLQWDIMRDFVISWNHPSGWPVGYILYGTGFIHPLKLKIGDPYISGIPPFGGAVGYEFFARSFEYDFATEVGYMMAADGSVWKWSGADSSLGIATANTFGQEINMVRGGPRWPGTSFAIDFEWPNHAQKFYVTLDTGGTPSQWNQFTPPSITYTFPPTTLTNSSRPDITFTYGSVNGVTQSPAPEPLSTVAINIYTLATTQMAGFKPDQGIGSIFNFYRSSITGVVAGQSYAVTTVEDLNDLSDYIIYTKVTSTDNSNSGWVARSVHTAFVRPAAPGFVVGTASCRTDPNNPTGARNVLVATVAGGLAAGQRLEFQFSDDGVNYYDVAGASATTSLTVYDYEAPISALRYYRVFRTVLSPFMRSLSSAVVQLTLPVPAGGGGWALKTISTAPTTVVLHAAAWAKTLQHPQSKNFPVSGRKAVVLSGGTKGFSGSLEIWSLDKPKHDAILALLANPQTLLLQSPFGEQWYVWPDDNIKFELVRAVKTPLETWPTRNIHKISVNVTEVERPLIVL